jgi:hypothetical protein
MSALKSFQSKFRPVGASRLRLNLLDEVTIERFAMIGTGFDEALLVYENNRRVLSPYIFFMKAIKNQDSHNASNMLWQIKNILGVDHTE